MKKDPGLKLKISLLIGDTFAVIIAFLLAYLVRTNLDSRPFYFSKNPWEFIGAICILIPIWWIILALLGLYSSRIARHKTRFPEFGRLLAASALGVMVLISYDFFSKKGIFPTRSVALWAFVFCFIILLIMRGLIRLIISHINRKNDNSALKTIIIGNNQNTERLIDHIMDFPEEGYRIAGVIAGNSVVPEEFRKYQYTSLEKALSEVDADVIIQTDEKQAEYIYSQAVKNHLSYYFVPTESSLSSHIGDLELIGDTPAILVKVTPLIGSARVVKRIMDIVLSFLMLIVAIIPMAIIWLILKLTDIKHSSVYSQYRLSRYNKKVKIYKFRSMKPEYSGMSPEEAFEKMGHPELIKKYRENGDFLPDDPRVTKLGRFLRASSLDELPQLFNVLKGDISLVGPRALVPGELRDYGDRSLLLSVKSGLTGLAQVSGRRDISFEERRALDLYYIQNWSILMDIQILFRTVAVVFAGKGAK